MNQICSMESIKTGDVRWESDFPGAIVPSKHHTVLYEVPPLHCIPPQPHVPAQRFHWDDGYVRMPFSEKNLFPSKDKNGIACLVARWDLIQEALLCPITDVNAFEAAVNLYNTKLPKFLALKYFFEEVLTEEESAYFFTKLLPDLINLALRLPELLPGNVPLLQANRCRSISLSQLQVSSVLANCFLCTFPWKRDAANYPRANFVGLFSAHLRPNREECVMEKLKCIVHYFRRVLAKPPVGVLTFERKSMLRRNVPRWDKAQNILGNTSVHICNTGTIEDDGLGMLQVDFANKLIGGGVLGFGCVQEEIRFVICPELIVARLFTEKLGDLEALVISGVERFSKYKGYGETFAWDGDFVDETPLNASGCRRTSIVAIDATHYTRVGDQFHSSAILRELNKAYTGFHSRIEATSLPAVATGNWGCGAFRGDVRLKFLVQLMACSATGRNMVYYTFGDANSRDELHNMHTFLGTNQITICQLWQLVCRFASTRIEPDDFYPFLQQAHFDSKTQPTIKAAFGNLSKPESRPSTSGMDVAIEIEATPPPEPVIVPTTPPVVAKTSETVKRKQTDTNDVVRLLGMIDGAEAWTNRSRDATGGRSFLGCIDEFGKKRRAETTVPMDVDELAVAAKAANGGGAHAVQKRISDYFNKS